MQLELVVERGDHVVPNMAECFPVQTASESELAAMSEEQRAAYYQQAMRQGLGSRLIQPHFTTVGKMKVKTPKYNCPLDLYSDTTMDEMISGTGSLDPAKLDPAGPAYQKMLKSKKFDPARSAVLRVMEEQNKGASLAMLCTWSHLYCAHCRKLRGGHGRCEGGPGRGGGGSHHLAKYKRGSLVMFR